LVPEYRKKVSSSEAYAIYRKILRLVAGLSCFCGIVLYLVSPWLAKSVFCKAGLGFFLALLAPFVLIMAINTLNVEALRALQNVKRYALAQFLSAVLTVTLLIVATVFFYHQYNPVYIMFGVPVLMLPILLLMVRRGFEVTKSAKACVSTSYILSLSFPMFLTSVMHLIMGKTDIIMLGAMAATRDVGIYSISLKLATLTSFILVAVNSMVAPKFAELYHSDRIDDLKTVAQESAKLIFFTTLPIILVYVMFGRYILTIFGPDFRNGALALLFLAIGQFINAAAGSVGYFLDMTGNQKLFQKIVMFGSGLNIVLNLVLIPRYGINGAAFASMISIAAWNVTAAYAIKIKYGFFISYLPWVRETR